MGELGLPLTVKGRGFAHPPENTHTKEKDAGS